jgi:hypothetical protein
MWALIPFSILGQVEEKNLQESGEEDEKACRIAAGDPPSQISLFRSRSSRALAPFLSKAGSGFAI